MIYILHICDVTTQGTCHGYPKPLQQHTRKEIQSIRTGTTYRHTTAYRHRHTAYRDSIQAQHLGTSHCTGPTYMHKILLELYQIFLGATSSNLCETWNVE